MLGSPRSLPKVGRFELKSDRATASISADQPDSRRMMMREYEHLYFCNLVWYGSSILFYECPTGLERQLTNECRLYYYLLLMI